MSHRPWTPDEDAAVRAQFPRMRTQDLANQINRTYSALCMRAQQLGVKKDPAWLAGPESGRMRPGQSMHEAGRFQKGMTPWNKGQHWHSGGRSVETQFKPGQKPQTWAPIGTVVPGPDGYLKRKVRDDAPPGMSRRNWIFVHRELWEQHHGPVPDGHAVAFVNGDRTDIRIENLQLVPRAALMRRNSVHNLPPELKQVVQLKGAVMRQVNKRRRSPNGERDDRNPA